jgi:hypothetical protein
LRQLRALSQRRSTLAHGVPNTVEGRGCGGSERSARARTTARTSRTRERGSRLQEGRVTGLINPVKTVE